MSFYDFMTRNYYDDDSEEEFRNDSMRRVKLERQYKINKHKAEKRKEKPESYVFYVYHKAMLQPDSNNCETCNSLNKNERLKAHNNYEYEENEGRKRLMDIDVYIRQRFTVNIKPKTRELFNNEEGVSRLAELCANTFLDDESSDTEDEFSELDQEEHIEYTDESLLVCFDEETIERDCYEYFKKYDIHETSVGCVRTCMGDWENDEHFRK
jgi:hypothetical protein